MSFSRIIPCITVVTLSELKPLIYYSAYYMRSFYILCSLIYELILRHEVVLSGVGLPLLVHTLVKRYTI